MGALLLLLLSLFAPPKAEGPTLPPQAEGCQEVTLLDSDLAARYYDYVAMDWGYGEWITNEDDFIVVGYSTQEDSFIYNHLECIYSEAEYPEGDIRNESPGSGEGFLPPTR